MKRLHRHGAVALLLMGFSAVVVADDICGDSTGQAQIAARDAEVARAEKSGNKAQVFLAYRGALGAECASSGLVARARANLPKLGQELAAKAEADGVLYSKEPPRADGKTSAFAWFEASGNFAEADRVMLKVVHAKPEDIELFKAAWNVESLSGRGNYKSSVGYRQELEKIAKTSAAKLMSLEEQDAKGLTADAGTLGTSAHASLGKLQSAAGWMQFLPEGDKPAKVRAEQRGDTIMKRGDAGLMGAAAIGYYQFAGSPKAAQVEAKMEATGRAIEKSSEKMQGSIVEKNEADQTKFKKGQADLEKELDF
ncbi:MAG TPA: hypothetical protein VN418_05480 [Gammaproteobacteria bacterium]|nr:hypothetical protein [Gammaproteobacteria bacterium]